jgi:hypothetical protein
MVGGGIKYNLRRPMKQVIDFAYAGTFLHRLEDDRRGEVWTSKGE